MTHEEAVAIIAPTGLIAAARADLPAVKAIVDSNPQLIEAMNALAPKPGEETPQRAAARGRKIEILQYFLDKGVQPDLFMACALGLTGLVDAYLTAHPKEVEAKGAHGIQLMVHCNTPQMVETLLKHGADPTLALQQLAWSGKVELLEVAIKAGGKVDPPDVGRRPLHIAAAMGHLTAVQLLMQHGADPHVRSKGADWERKNTIALAIMGNHTPVVEFLRKNSPPLRLPCANHPAPAAPWAAAPATSAAGPADERLLSSRYYACMTTVQEIKAAIEKLSLSERAELEKTLHGWTEDEWDRQMTADAKSGKFDRLIQSIDADIDSGNLRELP